MPSLDETIAQVLALPREAGTPEAARARALVQEYLRHRGYDTEVRPFAFYPSAPLALPVLGAGLGGLALALLSLTTVSSVPPWGAITVWLSGLAAVLLLAIGAGLGWVPLGGPRREDANIVATRGPGPVRRWIVAHLDTKAQGHSMAGRLVAVWVIGLAIGTLTALAVVRLGGPVPLPAAAGGALLAIVAGALAGRGRLKGTSLGARDNGSGVVAALAAAEASLDPATGVLITGAEEFGLVGARVFATQERQRLAQAVVINFDTLDQEGNLYLVSHDARGERLALDEAPLLAPLGLPLRPRRLPLGILTDSLPFARAGVPSITIGRLTWRTLRLLHTPRDTAAGLSLDTAARIGRAIVSN